MFVIIRHVSKSILIWSWCAVSCNVWSTYIKYLSFYAVPHFISLKAVSVLLNHLTYLWNLSIKTNAEDCGIWFLSFICGLGILFLLCILYQFWYCRPGRIRTLRFQLRFADIFVFKIWYIKFVHLFNFWFIFPIAVPI